VSPGRLGSSPLRIAVVGGGPAGLFAALLAKERMPHHEVVLYERNAPDATFGFGVVFSERTLGGFGDADSRLVEAMGEAGVAWSDIEVRRQGRSIRCGGHGFSAISRRTLLLLLQRRAAEAGVNLRFEHEATEQDLAQADLVLAADGVNSTVRARREAAFGPEFSLSAARYIWFATPREFDALTFIFAENEHGHWGLHAYPFEQGTSTFIVETDTETWKRSGLDACGDLPPGVSDMESLRYCEGLFAEHLGGNPVLENNSKWLQFGTLHCRSWCDGNVALLGDAAHTAHFSVGSGTKMAMEDAVALIDAIGTADDLPAALRTYEARRRPAVERIQAAAAPSLAWWERFRLLADRSDEEFAFHFLSRSPSITRERLQGRDWRFVDRVERSYAEANGADAGAAPLGCPLEIGNLRLASRLVVAPPADPSLLAAAAGAALYGAGLVLLPAGADPAIGSWLREHSEAAVGLRLAADADAEAMAEVTAGEFDLLATAPGSAAIEAWPTDRPLLLTVAAPLNPYGADADRLLDEFRQLAEARILLVGVAPADPSSVGGSESMEFCDRLREEGGLRAVLVDASGTDLAATALLAGRAELVLATPSLVSEHWRPGSVEFPAGQQAPAGASA
jgi:anthraniloyl-CoA monooxygenase